MKKLYCLLLAALISLPLFAQDDMGFILPIVGYKHLNLRDNKSYDVATAGLALHNHFNNIDFNGSFHWGKNYMSMEPFSLVGMLMFYFIKYGEGGGLDGGMVGFLTGVSAMSSMSFNIRIGEVVNIRPYWSLLRLTRLSEENEKGKFKLNGALGTHLTLEFNRIMINPYAEWTFGYAKKSPFMGYAFGVSVGIKLYDE